MYLHINIQRIPTTQEPIRTIEGLGAYYQAKARRLDTEKKIVKCEGIFRGKQFEVPYDYLVMNT